MIFNDEVDEGSTKAILTDYHGAPRETATLNEEDDLERSTPVLVFIAHFSNDEVDEGYTDWLPRYSAHHFERRKPPAAEHSATQSVWLSV